MKQVLLLSLVCVWLFSCKNNEISENEILLQRENDLIKRELEFEKKQNQIQSHTSKSVVTPEAPSKDEIVTAQIKELFTLLNDEIIKTSFDTDGNFSFDMGSASTGRTKGNIKQVAISIEYLPVRPGCADICPETAVIHFKCNNASRCISDPSFPEFKHNNGVITFGNIDLANQVFKLLKNIQKNI